MSFVPLLPCPDAYGTIFNYEITGKAVALLEVPLDPDGCRIRFGFFNLEFRLDPHISRLFGQFKPISFLRVLFTLTVVVENITKLFLSATVVSDKVLDWILIRVFVPLDMISQLAFVLDKMEGDSVLFFLVFRSVVIL